ncbi:MAG: flavodoxin [Butyrivibrio sp.]|nr:flavodoxin [Butyrivibrio sp.]
MKRSAILVSALLFMFGLGGCSVKDSAAPESAQVVKEDTEKPESTDTTEIDAEQPENTSDESKNSDTSDNSEEEMTQGSSNALVVYFSRTGEQYGVGVIDKGNTAIVADMIVDVTGADSYEVLPKEDYYPYTYEELTDIAKQEQNDNARPAIRDAVPDLSGYDTIFIGAPVWWGDWPMIMYTFFEENADALAGKTLIPFSTHAGSGLSGFDSKLSKALPDSTVGTGLAIAGTDTQNDQEKVKQSVNDWLSELGY